MANRAYIDSLHSFYDSLHLQYIVLNLSNFVIRSVKKKFKRSALITVVYLALDGRLLAAEKFRFLPREPRKNASPP